MFRFIAISLAAALGTTAAFAADLPSKKGAPVAPAAGPACYEKDGVPIDAFGFTSGSDINDHKALSGSVSYLGAYGTRFGSFNGHTVLPQLSYGLFPCVEVGPYLLGTATNARLAGTGTDINYYGGGIEMKYKVLGRDVHGLGLTLVVDPSIVRSDVPAGLPNFNVFTTGLRLWADKTLIPGKLFAAFNLSHDMTWTGPSGYFRNSTFTIGGSMIYQVADGLYAGGEVRHQRRYADLGFGNDIGNATFVGPTVYWQATKALGLSAVYNVQVAGKAKGVTGDLDLVNFNQHVVRVKAAYSF